MLDITPLLLLAPGAINTTPPTAASLNATLGTTVFNAPQIANGLLIYAAETAVVLIEILMVLAISMQLARGYFFRVLKKFTLRLAADIWWLIYVLLRDITILLVLLLGVVVFLPTFDLSFGVAVPFQPVAIVLYAFALVIILTKDTDESAVWDTRVTSLLAAGTGLYTIGVVIVTESAVQLSRPPTTVGASITNPWGFIYTVFNSANDHAMYMYTFYVSFLLLATAGLIAVRWATKPMGGGAAKKDVPVPPKPVIKTGPAATAPAPAPPAPKPSPSPAPTAAPVQIPPPAPATATGPAPPLEHQKRHPHRPPAPGQPQSPDEHEGGA